VIFLLVLLLFVQKPKPFIGVVTSVHSDTVLYEHDIMYAEESIANSFSPRNVNDPKFEMVLERIRSSKVNIRSANVFIPGNLKLVGPNVNEAAVLGYVDTVMQRCNKAGIQIIVLGSGEARRIPPGFDSLIAAKQFINLARKMADVASKYQRVIAMENLNHTETNFVLSLDQAIRFAKAIDHPSFKVTADIYHMLMENESPDVILSARDLLANVHIAEKEERAYPGKRGTDFSRYFQAMQKIGYSGGIMMECRWRDFPKEVGIAKAYLENQLLKADH
jgi:sugar phosphate isomerase/epimerase